EIGGQRGEPTILALGPTILDRDVLALDVAAFLQPLPERGREMRERPRRRTAEIADHRHRRLLRARRERPGRRRAPQKRHELAALHSITSPARASRVGGTSRPSAFAVVRLITRSNLVGCSTGMSAGFAPRKILSTNSPARRNRSV